LDAKAKIFEKLKNDFLEIIQNPFGNYVIQQVIEVKAKPFFINFNIHLRVSNKDN
jgi:hypothetical protein